MKIAFYSTTRNKIEDTLFYKSISKIIDKVKTSHEVDILYTSNNSEGLSFRYNQELYNKNTNYDYIVFVHDDVYIDDFNVIEKLIAAHANYDIVGLAGGVQLRITKPALWHLMCGGFGSGNLKGAVAHFVDNESIAMTTFGATPSRVAVLDGLFLSINVRKARSVGWKFNENFTFHHYDIASSIDANAKKLKLGVHPIWVIHKSPGLLNINDTVFTQSQEKFISEYSNHGI